jgi:hypothetical protein
MVPAKTKAKTAFQYENSIVGLGTDDSALNVPYPTDEAGASVRYRFKDDSNSCRATKRSRSLKQIRGLSHKSFDIWTKGSPQTSGKYPLDGSRLLCHDWQYEQS